MKNFLLSVILILNTAVFAQQASDYFPQQTGYLWNFKVIPLDSANNEIDSLTYFRADSFAVITNFMGRSADLVLSKSGPLSLINNLPYIDSSYFSFENYDGYQYFKVSNISNLTSVLDSIGLDSTFLGVIQSLEDWYSVFRFNQPVNSQYTIFTKDTTINVNGTNLPLRFQYLGKRLADDTIQTDAGTYACKRFLLSTVVSYIVFPPIVIELFRLETTKWISQNVWLVQEISPSENIDLSYLGYGSFIIPGSKTILIPLIVDVELTSFSAGINNSGKVILNWGTATETNNRAFQVERKNTDTKYINIGTVKGSGTTTNPHTYSFIDSDAKTGDFKYRLKQIDFDGTFRYSNEVEINLANPNNFELDQNYPNPFNPSTNIEFRLPETGNVSLKVYDILGREIYTIINGPKNAGTYLVNFNPDEAKLTSGIYIYVLNFKGMQLAHKMIFLK